MPKVKLFPNAVRLQTLKEIGAEDFFDSYLQFQYRTFAKYVKEQIKLNPNGFMMNMLSGVQCFIKYETVGTGPDSYKEFRVYYDTENPGICSVYRNVFELFTCVYYKKATVDHLGGDPEYNEAIIKKVAAFNKRLHEYRFKIGIVEAYLKLHNASIKLHNSMNTIKNKLDAFVDKHKEKFPKLAQAAADGSLKTKDDITNFLKKCD